MRRALAWLTQNRGSLVVTLAVRLFLTTLALTAILLLLIDWQLAAEVDDVRDRSLTSQAADISRHLQPGSDGRLALDLPPVLADAYSNPESGYFFQVRDGSGAILFASAGGATALDDLHPADPKTPSYFLVAKPNLQRIHAASVPSNAGGRILVIRVGQGENHGDVLLDEVMEDFLNHTGWALPLILAIFLLVNIWTLRHCLAPVERVSAMAAKIGPAEHIVLPEGGLPNEIRPLVRAVNSAVARLEDALHTQREFTADVAHELRTPLAVLNTHLDTLDKADAVAALKEDVQLLNRIVNQLLAVAKLDAFVFDLNQRTDLCALAAHVAAHLGHLAIKRRRSISLTVPDAPVLVQGDSGILQQALTNLVENALSHTPEGTEVEIIVGPNGSIHVDDEGPGIPESERKAVFERFWRKDHETSGAGIGLSIVRKIADAHNGKVRVSNSPRGGARFSLSLPLSANRSKNVA